MRKELERKEQEARAHAIPTGTVTIVHAGRHGSCEWKGSFLKPASDTVHLSRTRGEDWLITPLSRDLPPKTIYSITSAAGKYLYVDDEIEGCGQRRLVHLSTSPGSPQEDPRAHWHIEAFEGKHFIIHAGTFKGEYLYNKAEGLGNYVRTWKSRSQELAQNDAAARWSIISVNRTNMTIGADGVPIASSTVESEDQFKEPMRHVPVQPSAPKLKQIKSN